MKKSSKFSQLVTLAVAMFICATAPANAQQPSYNTQLRNEGFVTANGLLKNHYVLVPSETVPFVDVYLGDVEITIPARKRGEGPMVAPVRVLINGVQEVNPASTGVFVSPTTRKGWMRIHWCPKHLAALMADNPTLTGPGFGLVGGEEFVLEDGSFASQFYVPSSVKGGWVTGTGYGFLVFANETVRTNYIKSEAYTTLKKEREKLKDEEKPKTDEKKADEKKEEKKEEKKGENPTTQPTTQPATQPANKE